MTAVTTDEGVALSYATAGDGPPHLLFMHGWAGSARYFDATIDHLDLTHLGVVTYDLRGHLESAPAPDGYTLDQIAPDALRAAVVAPLAGARLALVDCGHEVPIEAPRELAALTEAFLAGLGWRGAAMP